MQQSQTNPNQDLGIRDWGIAVPVCRSQVMTGCLLVGASYALLNTQTHAVGAVAAVGVQDSKVRASMDTRNRGGSFWKQASPGVGVQRQRPHTLFIHRNPSRKELFFTAELDWCPLLCVDSQVVDLVFAMEDMERGLQEMAQSVEHMQEMLKRSPMVQALAQRKPEVRAPSALLSQNGRRGFHQVTLYEATRRCFTHQLAFPTDDGGLSLKNSI